MTWADAMGLVVIEGLVILVLVLTGFRTAVFHAVPAAAEGGDLGRHRPVHRADRLRRRRLRAPHPGRGADHRPGPARHRRRRSPGWPVLVFVVGLVAGRRPVGAPGRGRDPDLDRRHHGRRRSSSRRSADLGPSRGRRTPTAGRSTSPKLPSKVVEHARTSARSASSTCSAVRSPSAWWPPAAGLHADAGRLLRHDGHDDRDRRRGRPARRGGHPAERRSGSWSSTRSPRPPAARPASRRNTSYIESASGVGEGARTGLASVVTGVLFLLAIVLRAAGRRSSRSEAAVPALVLVGFLMMQQVKGIDWDDVEIAIPAFLTIVLMPFTYSITVGIGAGFVAYVADQAGPRQGRGGAPAAVGGGRAVRRLLRDRPDHRAGSPDR